MILKLINLRPAQTCLNISQSRHHRATTLNQSMMIKPSCPCCSDTLLRHMRFAGLYWRCSSCAQE
ncbi:MAG TPA: hypothetical protein DEG47_25005, partial [Cyanobacteria bacterium UBA11148]|nr:hypothetical protein [Cyanobacteria bacterium UBA11148]